jgi:hygromycin-B 7''-O-kinase
LKRSSLPGPMDLNKYEEFRTSPSLWLDAALDIARSHSLPTSSPHVFGNGSNLVLSLDEQIILKIFPPMLRHQYVSERTSLSKLQGKLSVPIPEIQAEGERDGWPYLAITRLEGRTGEEVWPTLGEKEKEKILFQIGKLIREVQDVPPGDLLKLDPQWSDFFPNQIRNCHARHARLGLPKVYLDGLGQYLESAASLIPVQQCSPVILTGEYIPENFLLQEGPGGWRLSGLFDFGDVMTGWREYDLLGPSTFMGDGKPGRIQNLFRGYGYADSEIDTNLTRRLMILYLLHRYSHPARQIRIEDWQEKAKSLHELERLIWPILSSGETTE